MIKNSEKFGLILLLCLSLTNFTGRPAFAENTLSQVDIRKNSTDGLEFTLYTSSPYADNVVVTKKSDNKYVILMPNVNSASSAKPDFSSVKDVVSDVDVRAVNDGAGGYTKVTVTTNKPVNIKTNTAKSMPVSEGQREYRALIAQKKTAPQTVSTASNIEAPAATGFKLPEIQPTKTAADIASTAPVSTAAVVAKAAETIAQRPQTTTVAKPAVEKKADTKIASAQQTQTTNIKPVSTTKTQTAKTEPAKSVQQPAKPTQTSTAKPSPQQTETKNVQKTSEPAENISNTQNIAETSGITNETQSVQPESPEKSQVDIPSALSGFMHKIATKMPKNLPITLTLILVPLICLISLFKLIRNSLIRSQVLKASFLNGISNSKKPVQSYDNIINNENLSWQEKYQQYMEASGETNEIEAGAAEAQKEKYTFITKPKSKQPQPAQAEVATAAKAKNTQPAPQAKPQVKAEVKAEAKPEVKPKVKSGSAPSIPVPQPKNSRIAPRAAESKFVKESRLEKLERMLQASPDIEKTRIEDDIKETESLPLTGETPVSETNSIHESMKPFKLKAFEEKSVLEETSRNKKIKHRRVQLELPREGQHVDLGYSMLHSNPRMLKNANLSVSDLIATNNKLLNIQPEFKEDKNDYEMISVDEYFNIVDDDKSRVTSSLSDVVANSLANMKQELAPAARMNKAATNPIAKNRNESKADYLSGLIVKSGFNIDSNRGFYLVSLDGKSAVVGRIGEEVFILKKFDRNINKPLQVRMDNPNVYMVKADDFKSLVEVSKDNMGVLIEL